MKQTKPHNHIVKLHSHKIKGIKALPQGIIIDQHDVSKASITLFQCVLFYNVTNYFATNNASTSAVNKLPV